MEPESSMSSMSQQSHSQAGRGTDQAPAGRSSAATAQQSSAPVQGDDNKPPQTAAQKKGQKILYFSVVLGMIIVGIVAGAIWWVWAQGHEDTDDSYVDGHITSVSSRVAGTVTEVFVRDNQRVSLNEALVKLDPRDYNVKVKELKASLSQSFQQADATQKKIYQSQLSGQGQLTEAAGEDRSAQAAVQKAKAALLAAKDAQRSAQAKVTEQTAQLEYAKTDFERYRLVYAEEAVTKQQYDKAKEDIKVAEAQLEQALHDLEQDKRKVLQAEADIHDAEARHLKAMGQQTSALASDRQKDIDQSQYVSQTKSVDVAKAQLDEALLNLSYCDINAPVDGRVGKKSVEVGQRIQAGQSLMALVQDDMWITANFKETQLNKMKIGQKAEIKIDSFPGKTFIGSVDSFSPASGAKFSVLPPDNATGNFTKVVQRVPVKIVLDRKSLGDYASRIAPGMSCITTVDFSK